MGINKTLKTLNDEIISIDKKNIEHLSLTDFNNEGTNKFLQSEDVEGEGNITVYIDESSESAGKVHIQSKIPEAPTDEGIYVLKCINGEYIWYKERELILGVYNYTLGSDPSATMDFDELSEYEGIYSRQGNRLRFVYYKDGNSVIFKLLEYLGGSNPESFGNFRLFDNDGEHDTVNATGQIIDSSHISVKLFGTNPSTRTFTKE